MSSFRRMIVQAFVKIKLMRYHFYVHCLQMANTLLRSMYTMVSVLNGLAEYVALM